MAKNADIVKSLYDAIPCRVSKGVLTNTWAAAWLMVAALAVPAAGADDKASPLSTLVPGDRVRVEVVGDRRSLAATIESVTADELVLRSVGTSEPLRLSLGQLDNLEVARGRRSQWRKGAIIGFVPGALFFGLIGGVLPCIDRSDPCFEGAWAATGALIGGGLTASAGALVGLAFKTDRWVRVHDGKTKASLTLAPTKEGMRLGFSVSF